jgi:hypothetical protein
MNYPGANPGERGNPIIELGKTIDVSFSLEASGELHPAGGRSRWASDTANPIVGYRLEIPEPSALPLAFLAPALIAMQRRGIRPAHFSL